MAEYASKGIAGTGLGFGIAGTALGLLNNGNGDGLLNGLLGGGNNKMTALMVENAELKAAKYTDERVTPLLVAQAKTEERITALGERMEMGQQIVDGKIAQAAQAANAGISQLDAALRCLRHTVDGIAATYVPAARVTPLPAPNPFPPVPPYGPYLPFPPFPPPVPPANVSGGTTQTPTQTQAGG